MSHGIDYRDVEIDRLKKEIARLREELERMEPLSVPSPIQGLVERLRAPGGKFASICHEAADALEAQAMCIHQMKASALDLDKAEETIAALRAEVENFENVQRVWGAGINWKEAFDRSQDERCRLNVEVTRLGREIEDLREALRLTRLACTEESYGHTNDTGICRVNFPDRSSDLPGHHVEIERLRAALEKAIDRMLSSRKWDTHSQVIQELRAALGPCNGEKEE